MAFLSTVMYGLFVILVAIWLIGKMRRKRKLPPGLTGFAACKFIVDCIKSGFDQKTSELMLQMKTDLVSLDLFGLKTFIIFGSTEKLAEAYQKKGEYLLMRPTNPVKPDTVGLLNGYGHTWREQRRFALSTLRNFGMGKVGVEERILHEVHDLVAELRSKNGEPVDLLTPVGTAVVNVIASVVFSSTFDHNDPDMKTMLGSFNELASGARAMMTLSMFSSFFELPGIKSKIKAKREDTSVVRSIMSKRIDDKKAVNHDIHHTMDDFVDAYMFEMKKRKTEIDTSFTESQLIEVVEDLFGAGSETTSTTLRWAMLLMCHHPDIQNQVRKELLENIGHDRVPKYSDRERTPYTEAVILEIQRFASMVPMVRRINSVDIDLFGYNFEPNTNFIANFWHMNRDENVWLKPHDFYPGHFYSDEGKVINKENFNPFGLGKRQCLGESLARMELYLFFTSLILNFTFTGPENCQLPSPKEAFVGMVRAPKYYKLCAARYNEE